MSRRSNTGTVRAAATSLVTSLPSPRPRAQCRVVYFKTKHGDIDETALKKAFEQYNKSEQLQQSPWSLDPSKDVCDAWRKTLRDVSEVTSFLHDDAK